MNLKNNIKKNWSKKLINYKTVFKLYKLLLEPEQRVKQLD